jgi:uncharacterized protein YbaA (DUF1428 family)
MAKYIDQFIVPVPRKNLEKYKKICKIFGKVYREYGALEYHEYVSDDVKKGKVTSFPQAVKLKSSEVVVLSLAVFKSRAHRDRVNKKAMQDPRLVQIMEHKPWPFDGMRSFGGGFKSMIEL